MKSTILSLALVSFSLAVGAVAPTAAQLIRGLPPQPGTAPLQPGQVTTPPVPAPSAPTSGLPANILTPSTTNQLAPSTGAVTNFGGAGRGLPGLQGGPPLNTPMGAQDPTADYMRPPAIGPLFCDAATC
ncbi:MAG TPA: hypothetical protein VFS39_17955 [Nitrospira sp.]|nr:hypothetical protein [Nitrospira sp.]